ncbi:nucleobase:cation symporter-2 family protein [Thermosyntropha sp.]|uniref:uracil-xanthine permease family protein n=1 Tax=Thermosyntropha sp. TaxID=2740820 RepID=UPI0025D92553|nr:nucleobase:cation symporter-2 family protein [Thermosyntropha sp.]MBO8159491.1 purine permease [Thermosyntropha sp.]
MTNVHTLSDQELIYKLDGKPSLGVAIPLGMQHVLAMFIGNIAPIIIITNLLGIPQEQKVIMLQCAMIFAGLVTLVQIYPIGPVGARLPIVVGTSFAFVPSAIAIGKAYGIAAILGASLLGSLAAVLVGIFIKQLRRFFPPLVTGTVLIAIGLSLMPVGVNYFAGGVGKPDYGSPENLMLGFIVLITVILLQRFTKGILNVAAILIALVVGYLIAIPMGKVDFSVVAQAGWLSFPRPLMFGLEFHWDAIIKFAIVYLIVSLEIIGNLSAITLVAENREATEREMGGAIIADALGSALAAIFNIMPLNSYGQNAGIIAFTRVVNRFCVATGAIFLILAGIIPKVGAVVAAMPSSVLGGAVIVVFAMITITGMKMIATAGLTQRNTTILAIAFGVGLSFSFVPAALEHMPAVLKAFLEDGVVAAGILALVFNVIFPEDKEENLAAEETAEIAH